MKIVAITGSIGCGKTFLSNLIRNLGYVVYDADKWVKYLYYKKDFLSLIKDNFPQTFDDKGVFNKRKLRNLVFNDVKELKKLEKLIHPFLKRKLLDIIKKHALNEDFLFIDVALLFEMHWDKYCNKVIVADVNREIQKQRVMNRDNISAEDFEKIVDLQIDNELKKKYADIVINTDETAGILKIRLANIIEGL